MERQLWAPWRISYILGPKPDECVFCIPDTEEEDEERLILHRGKNCFVIMNKYPYNNGHIMVCPYRHVMNLADLDADTIHEIMDYLQFCTKVLKANFHCPGINIGLNMGEAAGADPKTFAGLAGVGDLIATCGSPLSRNYTFGSNLGKGLSVEEATKVSNGVAEGVPTADAVVALGKQYGVPTPLATAMSHVLSDGISCAQMLSELFGEGISEE